MEEFFELAKYKNTSMNFVVVNVDVEVINWSYPSEVKTVLNLSYESVAPF